MPVAERLPLCAMASTCAAGLLLVGGQPASRGRFGSSLPSGRERGVGLDLAAPCPAVAEDDDAVQVVAAGVGGPLVADEGGEAAGLVGLLGGLDGLVPGRAVGARAGQRGERRREACPCEKRVDRSRARASTPCSPPAWTMSYQRRPVGSASISGSPANSRGKKPMLSEWSATTRKSSGRDEPHGLAASTEITSSPLREAVGVARAEAGAEGAGVHREARCAGGCRPRRPASGSCGRRRASRPAPGTPRSRLSALGAGSWACAPAASSASIDAVQASFPCLTSGFPFSAGHRREMARSMLQKAVSEPMTWAGAGEPNRTDVGPHDQRELTFGRGQPVRARGRHRPALHARA